MPVNAREAAFNALTAFRKRGARPDFVIARHGPEDPRERALALNITDGVLQNEMYLDACIAQCSYNTKKLQPVVRDILRLSAYQMLFLDRVPDRAAVNEGVELAKRYAPRTSGLVNAVLRRISERGGQFEIDAGDRAEYLSIRWSHPEWLVRELIAEYGEETCERILMADNTPAPITAQVNTLKTTAGELRASLEARGINVEACPYLDDALYLSGTGSIEGHEEFLKGHFYVQDAAARFAVLASGVKPGDTVLDMCAAPGGKSFAAAIAMKDRGRVLSFDIHEKKTALIEKGAERLGLSAITASAGDARSFVPELAGLGDVVLADVPCSGIGVIRKKPEIRYKDPKELERLPAIQLEILKSVARYVKPGGRLVYSTCTILRRENEDVVESFLKRHGDFEPVGIELPEPFGKHDKYVTILPPDGGTDGFFICVLRKK